MELLVIARGKVLDGKFGEYDWDQMQLTQTKFPSISNYQITSNQIFRFPKKQQNFISKKPSNQTKLKGILNHCFETQQ